MWRPSSMLLFTAMIAVILVSSLVVILNQKNNETPYPLTMKSVGIHVKANNSKETSINADNWSEVQFERIKLFREKCQKYKLNAANRSDKDSLRHILHSEKYKLAFKPFSKIGSTILRQVIYILSGFQTEQVFDMSRNDVHRIEKYGIEKSLTLENLDNYTFLILTRNPYSRIYSAYVDKVFLNGSSSLCKEMHPKLFVKNNRTCKCKISFGDFLEYVFQKGKSLVSGHYNPIMSISYGAQVCNIKNIRIVKQETFSEDIEQVLKLINVNRKMYDIIYGELHSKRTESTIKSILKTIYKNFSLKIQYKSCFTWKDMAGKLWKSFQLQGYIHKYSKFPYDDIDEKLGYETLLKTIMTELKEIPLTHEEQLSQRKVALLKAYSNIDEKYICEIRKRYAMDFEMFKYKTDLSLSEF